MLTPSFPLQSSSGNAATAVTQSGGKVGSLRNASHTAVRLAFTSLSAANT